MYNAYVKSGYARKVNPVHKFKNHYLRPILILSSHLSLGLLQNLYHNNFPIKILYILPVFPCIIHVLLI
jgi:hypothetical protein